MSKFIDFQKKILTPFCKKGLGQPAKKSLMSGFKDGGGVIVPGYLEFTGGHSWSICGHSWIIKDFEWRGRGLDGGYLRQHGRSYCIYCIYVRYILRAHPPGTNWYHSHVGTQRDEGIFGALIVKEEVRVVRMLSSRMGNNNIQDNRYHMMAITEHMKKPLGFDQCSPDGTSTATDLKVHSFQMNGIKLDQTIDKNGGSPQVTFTI
jgi:hypothetical protein